MIDIVIDFDGTCVTHDFPKVGRDIGAVPVLKELAKNHRLILFTMRSGISLIDTVHWFKDNDIPLFGIQRNPEQDSWTASPKAYGQLIIDDATLGAPLMVNYGLSTRPFIDWEKVAVMLKESSLI